jgi:hypothetical protein
MNKVGSLLMVFTGEFSGGLEPSRVTRERQLSAAAISTRAAETPALEQRAGFVPNSGECPQDTVSSLAVRGSGPSAVQMR